MSGHSKWHSIRHKKGIIDAKRGKVFTLHANLITVAARNGGDPDMNPSLRLAIDNAKKANVPNANIERAIKRGTGELKDGAQLEEVTYEGFGPSGIAVIVEALTDNKNRTLTNVRTIINKKGGNLGASGSVSWMFNRKGVIQVSLEGKDSDEIEMAAIEAGAEDIKNEGDSIEIHTDPSQLTNVNDKLKEAGIEIENAETMLIPNETKKIESKEEAEKVLSFMEAIEEDQDVTKVSSNFDIDEELL